MHDLEEGGRLYPFHYLARTAKPTGEIVFPA